MNALASALEISAKIVREYCTEMDAKAAIWKKIIELKRSPIERNTYNETMIRGYISVLRALGGEGLL